MEEGSDQPRGDAYVYDLSEEEAYLQTDQDEKPEIIAEPPPDPAWFKCWFCRSTNRRMLLARSTRCGTPTPSPSSRKSSSAICALPTSRSPLPRGPEVRLAQ